MIRFRPTPKAFICLIVIFGLFICFYRSFYGRDIENHSQFINNRYISDRDGLTIPYVETPPPSALKINVLNFDPEAASKVTKSAKKVESSVCKIPKLEKDNPQVLASYREPKPLECEKNPQNWLFVDQDGKLQATEYGKSDIDIEKMKCSASYFYRLTDMKVKWKHLGQIPIGYPLTEGDFTKIECETDTQKWKHLFMNIAPKKEIIEKVEKASRSSTWSGLSAYWFAFDSLSQMAFRRSLPKTIEYLEKKMGSIVLNGYNIVGDGTPQAYIPILTGKTELELPLTRKRYKDANFVDVYPFIWNKFSDNGYVTMYGEDAANIGTFTYRLKGFRNQPTDHYTRTFFLLSEKHFPSYHCFGSETQFKSWIRYGKEFMEKYPKETPKFGVLHHSDLSHDDITLVKVADDDLKAHFEELFEGGYLDNTVVFVGADHGHRFAALRETQQGQMEERLPFMSVFLPETFKSTVKGEKVFRNLKENANRLTTPFDMHETFADILSLPDDLDTVQNASESRGLSLFRPIPESRTCEQAEIEAHWCTCLSWQKGNDETAEELAKAVIQTINSYTEGERKLCAPLRLQKVIESKTLVPDEKLLQYAGSSDKDGFVPNLTGNATVVSSTYMITFTTLPGNARYEATVQYDEAALQVTVDMLTISHVNKYGDTPHCIIDKNYFLATYCVCYDKIGGI
jgi:hypothetical protein